jgi:hypothetical protein
MNPVNMEKAAEPLLGMREIANLIRHKTGHRPSRSVLWRWHLTGRLKTIRVGSRLFATASAIDDMLAQDERRNLGSCGSRAAAAKARMQQQIGPDPSRSHAA